MLIGRKVGIFKDVGMIVPKTIETRVQYADKGKFEKQGVL